MPGKIHQSVKGLNKHSWKQHDTIGFRFVVATMALTIHFGLCQICNQWQFLWIFSWEHLLNNIFDCVNKTWQGVSNRHLNSTFVLLFYFYFFLVQAAKSTQVMYSTVTLISQLLYCYSVDIFPSLVLLEYWVLTESRIPLTRGLVVKCMFSVILMNRLKAAENRIDIFHSV